MKVLIVCSQNSGSIAPFISDQTDALVNAGIEVLYFTIQGKGILGYMRNFRLLKQAIKKHKPNLIHAHYGLSGLLANLQKEIPVITTYHGSDINNTKVLQLSRISMLLSVHNIFVSDKNRQKVFGANKHSLIPCGVDLAIFKPITKTYARETFGLEQNASLVLFAGNFQNKVKNPGLAQAVAKSLPNIRLLELKGYSREQVALLMNAVDVCLLTSFTEGSPQFIKETMACNKPIVSTNVGDVAWLFGSESGYFMTNFTPEDVTNNIMLALEYSMKNNGTKGRDRIIDLGLDSKSIAKKIVAIYKENIKS